MLLVRVEGAEQGALLFHRLHHHHVGLQRVDFKNANVGELTEMKVVFCFFFVLIPRVYSLTIEHTIFILQQRGCDSTPSCHTTSFEAPRWPNNQVDK